MAVSLGNLLGAAANLTTAFAKPKSLKEFLFTMNDFGIQVANNFEVNFSGLEDVTFFVQDVSFGGMQMQYEDVYYNGRSIPIPCGIVDYDHSASMTILNDARGYIYAAITNFLMQGSYELVNSGYTMTIKCLTGDPKYKGSLITLNNVQFEKIAGMSFGYSTNDITKFNVDFQYLDFTFTPGALGKAAGIVGAVDSMIR